MAGLPSFYGSQRFSDVTLVLRFSKTHAPTGVDFSPSPTPEDVPSVPASAPSFLEAMAIANSAAQAQRAYLDSKAGTEEGAGWMDQDAEVRIPAHRVTLSASSELLNTRLRTDVGGDSDTRTAVVEVYASSLEEMEAMEAVIEFIYTSKLAPYSTASDLKKDERAGNKSVMRRLLATLEAANCLQVGSCFTACCRGVRALPIAELGWDDYAAIKRLPAFVKELPEVLGVMAFAEGLAVELAVLASNAVPASEHAHVRMQLLDLPASTRLKLLKSGRLGYRSMWALVNSSVQIADSEDSMALHLSSYLKGRMGKTCSPQQIRSLIEQLRYQHMSNNFIGLQLPMIENIRLSSSEMSHLLYLRGLTGGLAIPEEHRQPGVPRAWYTPARKPSEPAPTQHVNSFELTLDISESYLAEHLAAVVLFKAGGKAPPNLASEPVMFRGTSWCVWLVSRSVDQPLCLQVLPEFTPPVKLVPTFPYILHGPAGQASDITASSSNTAGIYVEITTRCDSSPSTDSRSFESWIGEQGWDDGGCFLQFWEDGTDISTEPSWWQDHITDGQLRFSATVKYL